MIKFGRPVPADVDARIARVAEQLALDERLEAVWLFGSRARGEADALSDVDLAVFARRDLTSSELWDAQIEWTGVAADILGTDEVAVQAVNHLPVALRHAILRDARLLWARDPQVASHLEAVTLKRYLDLKPHLDTYDRELFRQAASGKLR